MVAQCGLLSRSAKLSCYRISIRYGPWQHIKQNRKHKTTFSLEARKRKQFGPFVVFLYLLVAEQAPLRPLVPPRPRLLASRSYQLLMDRIPAVGRQSVSTDPSFQSAFFTVSSRSDCDFLLGCGLMGYSWKTGIVEVQVWGRLSFELGRGKAKMDQTDLPAFPASHKCQCAP